MNCVATSSYNLLFAVAVIIGIAILLISFFSYDRVRKFEVKELEEDVKTVKNATIATISVAAVGLGIMFILFFGFRKQLKASVAQTVAQTVASVAQGNFPLPSSLRK